jgi:hypothetical protein
MKGNEMSLAKLRQLLQGRINCADFGQQSAVKSLLQLNGHKKAGWMISVGHE